MTWFFAGTLDEDSLLASLRQTLTESFPMLCGRYHTLEGMPFPTALQLSNEGVEVYLERQSKLTLSEAMAHLPLSDDEDIADAPSVFNREAHAPFAPVKTGMDPDGGSASEPLMRIKITTCIKVVKILMLVTEN